jgi:WD40 repeat protein
MDKRAGLLLVAFALGACAPGSPTKSDPQVPAATHSTDEMRDQEPDVSAAEALAVASPQAGPAQDSLPPIPPRPVERTQIDLTSLTEAPMLEIDGQGHTSKVRALLFSHDGHFVVSAGYDKTVRVWSTSSGELVRTIRGENGEGPGGRIYAAALSDGDQFLAVGGWLGKYAKTGGGNRNDAHQIRVLDFYSGNTVRVLAGHSDVVLSLAFSRHGRRLVSGGADRMARVWDASTGRIDLTLGGHSDGVSAVAFAPDDSAVATASLDKTVRLWDVTSGRLIASLSGHGAPVQAVAFTPDGRYLLSGSMDRTIRMWDARTGAFLKVLAQQGSGVSSLSITPDGRRVVTGCADGEFVNNVFSIPDGRPAARFTGHDNIVLATAISPNGRWAASAGGSDHSIALWDIDRGTAQVRMAGHGATVWSVGFGADDRTIAFGNRFDQKGYSDYQMNGPLEHRFTLGLGGQSMGIGADLSSDNGFVRARTQAGSLSLRTPTGREDANLELWDGGNLQCKITRDSTSGFDHRSYTLTPDAGLIVSGGANGTLVSYDARTGYKRRDFVGHTGDVLAVAVSPSGRYLVSGSNDQTVRIWNLASGALLSTIFHSRNGQWIAFTPAGYYASSAYGDAYVGWHVNRGPAQTAGYFAASSLSGPFRTEAVVANYIETGGDMDRSIALANQTLPEGQAPITYHRFEDLPQFAPPSVYMMNPGVNVQVSSDRLEVTAKAYAGTGEPITEIYFLVNGRRVDERWWQNVGRPRLQNDGRLAEITAVVPLVQALNRISVVVKNRLATSEPETIEARRLGGAGGVEKILRPNLYVLSIGISHYDSGGGLPALRFADADARSVSDVLTKQAGKLYGRVQARTLTEAQASRSNVLEGLRWLKSNATQSDVAVIFLAGHAVTDQRAAYYFLPYGGKVAALDATGVRWTEFQSVLDGLPSKVVLMADTCHSGSITGTGERARGVRTSDLTAALRATITAGSGVVVMTASTGAEQSFESDKWSHGAFTKAVLEGIAGKADYDKDHAVYVSELDHYVTSRVQRLTEGRQHPTTQVPRSMPSFPLIFR